MSNRPRGCVFLDRDGTVVKSFGNRPANTVEEIEIFDGVAAGLQKIKASGLSIIVVSNQGGIALGYMTNEVMVAMNDRLQALVSLKKESPVIDAFYWCPHKPDEGCRCRKPGPGMFYKAKEDFGIDMGKSYVIGDRPSDMDAGVQAGIPRRFLVVQEGYVETPSATLMFPIIADALQAVVLMEGLRK
jgi:D-glycero-D-manno-heptose 1,7-bisphosphate phosphatase